LIEPHPERPLSGYSRRDASVREKKATGVGSPKLKTAITRPN